MFRKLCSTLLVALLFSTTCHAGLVTFDNKIFGATDINVDGRLYDWEITAGRCSFYYTVCDVNSEWTLENQQPDFAFKTQEEAIAANLALIDVLSEELHEDLFFAGHALMTPFGEVHALPRWFDVSAILLLIDSAPSEPFVAKLIPFSADANESFIIEELGWSIWTPQGYVPEPGTAILMLLGLVGLSLCQSRKTL